MTFIRMGGLGSSSGSQDYALTAQITTGDNLILAIEPEAGEHTDRLSVILNQEKATELRILLDKWFP